MLHTNGAVWLMVIVGRYEHPLPLPFAVAHRGFWAGSHVSPSTIHQERLNF
jgi:hypothetical protein